MKLVERDEALTSIADVSKEKGKGKEAEEETLTSHRAQCDRRFVRT